MSRSHEFYVNSVQPYLFEIKDVNGEIAREYLTLDVGVAPQMLFSVLQNEDQSIKNRVIDLVETNSLVEKLQVIEYLENEKIPNQESILNRVLKGDLN